MLRRRPDGATLIQILRELAEERSNDLAFRFLSDGEIETETLTFGELDRRARWIAAALARQTAPGMRACLFFPAGTNYVSALFGSLYAGLIAVPAYPPRSRRRLPRLEGLIDDPAQVIALTTTSVLALLKPSLETAPERLRNLRWMVIDDECGPGECEFQPADVASGSVAMIQYTSGSTTRPRGVMISHGNLIHNLEQIRQRFGSHSGSRGVIWLPPYHDMGLIGGILQPVYTGFTCTLMSPSAFLQRPVRWLQAISKYGGTISGGPDSAYDLCTRKVAAEDRQRLDLSTWEVAFNGAEPVRWETMERFAEAFAPCGFRRRAFRPCYGLAEGTLMVSSGRALDSTVSDGAKRIVTGCGAAVDDTDIRIVDPQSLTEAVEGGLGEIWVSGPSVAQGYFNCPEETSETFRAEWNGVRYLRTGDLGYLRGGELFVTGRLKDLIILHGTNYYPHDIEATVQASHSALAQGIAAAFAIAGEGRERLIVVVETGRREPPPAAQAALDARTALAEINGLELDELVLVKPGSIPKTSSGKVRRGACREAYLAGTLDVVSHWRAGQPTQSAHRSETEIRNWLMRALGQRLNLTADGIDPRRPFTDHGLESADAVALTVELENWLGQPAAPMLIWDFPSVDALAAHLARPEAGPRPSEKPAAAAREPIAIVGMGCRFPGAPSPEAFWKLLQEGRHAVIETPPERWSPSGENGAGAGWGAFLNGIDLFDPYFFGIAPREAEHMDPQQRLLLEVAWEALENAGQAPQRLAGTSTGVFVGVSGSDYAREQSRGAALDIYSGTGNALSIVANRISYTLDLKGPSIAVDTACSSSLVAVHLAVESLQRRESALAIAGGVNLMISPDVSNVFSRARMLAPDGKCKVFDASADGYVRGEGCGVVVLKRLSDALANGDRIGALILGSGVNQDGRTNGLTAPNGPSQRALVVRTLAEAGVTSTGIGYVETHGTGTPLGDPIEVQALADTFASGTEEAPPCWMGSVKANIGHLEPAAGIASLIKTVLALEKQSIPPQIHVQNVNPRIALDATRLRIPGAATPWLRNDRPRLALVNSFGFGGTNATLVLAEGPSRPAPAAAHAGERHLFTLSARTERALRRLALSYADFLDAHAPALADFCFTANSGRAAFPYRLAAVVQSAGELVRQLRDFGAGESSPGILTAKVDGTPQGEPVAPRPNQPRPSPEELRELFLAGFEVDWSAFESHGERSRLALPTYPFERERFWIEKAPPAMHTDAQLRPLLARRVQVAVPVFETTLSTDTISWLGAHRVRGQIVFPAAAYLEMALEAAMEVSGESSFDLKDVAFERALVLAEGESRLVQLVLSDSVFRIFSRSEGAAEWVMHCTGNISPCEPAEGESRPTPRGAEVNIEQVYVDLERVGLAYGDHFRGLRQAWREQDRAWGRVELHPDLAPVAGDFAIHPALLDACLHVLAPLAGQPARGMGLPIGIDRFRWRGQFAIGGLVSAELVHTCAGVQMWNDAGSLVFEIAGLRMEGIDSPPEAAPRSAPLLHELRWESRERSAGQPRLRGRWVIVPGDLGLAAELHSLMCDAGARCEMVSEPGQLPPDADEVICLSPAGGTNVVRENEQTLLGMLAVVKSVIAMSRLPRLWLVTRGPLQAGVAGFGRVVAIEHPGLRCTVVDLDHESGAADLLAEFCAADGETQVAWRAGGRLVARIAVMDDPGWHSLETPAGESYHLAAPAPGNLAALSLQPEGRLAPGPGEVEVRVRAAGLNFSDVMKALGVYPGAAGLGAEFAGIVERVGEGVTQLHPGDGVMGVAPHSLAPFVTTPAALAIRIPSTLRHEEAATIPVAFLTAHYALHRLARLRKGERILIHAGAGGVGLAALQLAQSTGAEIYATAGSPEKRAFLQALGCAGVFDSRSLEFVEGVRAATGGQGVDVVLNSLAGDLMSHSLLLVAPHGRFVEIGKSDIYQNRHLDLAPFQRAISYFAVDLDRMFRERRDEIREMLAEIAGAFERGEWKPLPLRVFDLCDAQQALRHMAQARHIGKVVLTPQPPAAPLFQPDATYLVTGGLGALGLQVAAWMADAGARHIVLLSRSPRPLQVLQDRGIDVIVKHVDVSDRAALEDLPPVRGIIHAAGVLADSTLANLREEDLRAVMAPKAAGAWNLHEWSLGMPLDFFVLFSSLASVAGSPGQAGYAAANAFLDGLAGYRQSLGLPALSINWGPWAGQGMAARTNFAADGVTPLEPAAALRTLEKLLRRGACGQVIVAAVDWNRLGAKLPGGVPPLLSHLYRPDAERAPEPAGGLREKLRKDTPEERRDWLESHILEHVGRVSGIPVTRLSLNQKLGDLGIDSLTALELTNNLEQTLRISLPLALMNGDVRVVDLTEQIAERLMA